MYIYIYVYICIYLFYIVRTFEQAFNLHTAL